MNDATEHRGGIGAGPPETAIAVKLPVTPARAPAPVAPPLPSGLRGGGATAEQHPAYGQKPANVRRIEPPAGFWLPAWVRTMVDAKASPEALVRAALDRIAKDHTEATLVEAQTIINEVTRSADHATVVKSILTHDAVKPLLAAPKA